MGFITGTAGKQRGMNSTLELLAIVVIISLPTLPASLYLAAALRRRRSARSEMRDVAAGRASETPFVVIATVGTAIAGVATLAVALTILARALA